MKVNIYETVEVSDEQRVQMAAVLDGTGAKKRIANREEIKSFVWSNGQNWEAALDNAYTGEPEPDDQDDDDLI